MNHDLNSLLRKKSENKTELTQNLVKIKNDNYKIKNLNIINTKILKLNKKATIEKIIEETKSNTSINNNNKNEQEQNKNIINEKDNITKNKNINSYDYDYNFPEIKINSKNELVKSPEKEEPEFTFIINNKKSRSQFYKKFKRNVSRYNTSINNSDNFCYICLSLDHSCKTDCPIYKRCYKCLKYGHWANNCKEKIEKKCENCKISAHNKEDCLRNPPEIKLVDILLSKKIKIKCAFCDKKNHFICPFSSREKFILNFPNGDKNQNGAKKDYSDTLFCPHCAGNHLKKNCPEINKEKKNKSKSGSNNSNNNTNDKSTLLKYNKDKDKDRDKDKDLKEINSDKNTFLNKKREKRLDFYNLNKKYKKYNNNDISERKTSNFSWTDKTGNNNNNNNYKDTNNDDNWKWNKDYEINWISKNNNRNNYNNNKRNNYYNNYNNYNNFRRNKSMANNYYLKKKSELNTHNIYSKQWNNDYKNKKIRNISNSKTIQLEEENENDFSTKNIYNKNYKWNNNKYQKYNNNNRNNNYGENRKNKGSFY